MPVQSKPVSRYQDLYDDSDDLPLTFPPARDAQRLRTDYDDYDYEKLPGTPSGAYTQHASESQDRLKSTQPARFSLGRARSHHSRSRRSEVPESRAGSSRPYSGSVISISDSSDSHTNGISTLREQILELREQNISIRSASDRLATQLNELK